MEIVDVAYGICVGATHESPATNAADVNRLSVNIRGEIFVGAATPHDAPRLRTGCPQRDRTSVRDTSEYVAEIFVGARPCIALNADQVFLGTVFARGEVGTRQ